MIQIFRGHFFVAIAFALTAVSTAPSQTIIAGPTLNVDNGHIYYLLSPATWTASESTAIVLGGHLATIRNQSEQDWVFNTFGTVGAVDRSLWIGLNDAAIEGTFVWASGESPTYTNWFMAQPDNNTSFGGEHYVQMVKTGNGFAVTPGTWNDLDNLDSFPALGPTAGVVEVIPVPEPTSLLMVCGVLVGVAAKRWRNR